MLALRWAVNPGSPLLHCATALLPLCLTFESKNFLRNRLACAELSTSVLHCSTAPLATADILRNRSGDRGMVLSALSWVPRCSTAPLRLIHWPTHWSPDWLVCAELNTSVFYCSTAPLTTADVMIYRPVIAAWSFQRWAESSTLHCSTALDPPGQPIIVKLACAELCTLVHHCSTAPLVTADKRSIILGRGMVLSALSWEFWLSTAPLRLIPLANRSTNR